MSAQQEGNEAPAEEGAAAAVVRPDHYQQGDEQAMLVSFHMEQCIMAGKNAKLSAKIF